MDRNVCIYALVNGALTVLPSPADDANAYPKDRAVSGGRTYVTGGYFATSNGAARACYRVNGAVTKLDMPHAEDAYSDHTESILVSGGSIESDKNRKIPQSDAIEL